MDWDAPIEVEEAAARQNLGAPVKRYIRLGDILYGSLMGAFFFISVPLAIAHTFFGLDIGSSSYDPVTVVGGSCLALLLAALLWYYAVRASATVAYLYTDGFVEWQRRKRRVLRAQRWDKIKYVSTRSSLRGGLIRQVTDIHGHTYRIFYPAVWRHCKRYLRQHASAQAPGRQNQPGADAQV